MRSSDIMLFTPAGWIDPKLAIAACRAGALGVLDLEHASVQPGIAPALAQLQRHTRTPFGVKLGSNAGQFLESLTAFPDNRLQWVVLAGGPQSDTHTWIHTLRAQQRLIAWEATTLAEAQRGVELQVDALILKGHEAGGRVSQTTSFVLLQAWAHYAAEHQLTLPAWLQGGVGLHTIAAAQVGGAAGVVLDHQLLLTRESPLNDEFRHWLSAFDGSTTQILGERLGQPFRVFSRPGWSALEEALREEQRIFHSMQSEPEQRQAWQDVITRLSRGIGDEALWHLGQDAASARSLAEQFVTVGGVIQGLVEAAANAVHLAQRLQPLHQGARLAQQHRTRYPILQGPMTRVSDTAAFAEAVAEAGGLPFLALALLRKADTERLLEETQARIGERSWGVGILGFVPPEIRAEQLAAIAQYKPPFAIIAGGRPDQAKELEDQGIATWLHVPSPGLLKRFLKDGARRFIFEGRECGGHVGPRTSLVLWNTMIQTILDHLGSHGSGEDLQVAFAGGIHDARSSAMVAALAAPLAERGVAVGILMGTAYLFTEEAVASGAIVPRFQAAALSCQETVLLQTGPGHAIRCVPTPYHDHFEREKRRLEQEGRSHEEIVKTLEWMNMGRLRIASKGLDRQSQGNGPQKLSMVSDAEQYQRGMYMIGQVAGLRQQQTTMAALHAEVCQESLRYLHQLPQRETPIEAAPAPCDIAIVGMACYYPKAGNLTQYWDNILHKVNAVDEIPASHWDWRLYYDPNPRAKDKIISKWGGFLDDIHFDPLTYGITPNSLKSIEPLQLYLLEVVRHALANAGYAQRPFNRDRTAAILGIGGGGSPLAVAYGFRTCLPMLDHVPGIPVRSSQVVGACEPILPDWTEDSFPGILLNVAVGRITNRFNLGGPNYAIDAACGSSLAAVHACIRELETGTSDVAIAMGADTVQTPYAYMAFSKTHALSPRGRCRPFDAGADGIALSEGIGAVVLKRLADAERDGDTIYAVIKGIGASSDGKDKGLTAPRPEGQLRALNRAYAQAGIPPAWVGLVEAHGTGTVVGDQTEAQSLGQVFREAGATPQSCALGSVKSMIGHSKCAAGIAGLIKAVKALYHKVLPPTLVEQPNPRGNFEDGPLYLNTEPRPWVHGQARPRYAGVSAFGFGGTNFHTVLEEYTRDYLGDAPAGLTTWPAELLVWRRPTRAKLIASVRQVTDALNQGARPSLSRLAFSLWRSASAGDAPTLAVVAQSHDDLVSKLQQALEYLSGDTPTLDLPQGVYFSELPSRRFGNIAFLFPGQGSQYVNMLAQIAVTFDQVRQELDQANQVLTECLNRPLSTYLYPPSTFTLEAEKAAQAALTQTEVAQPALGATSLGLLQLLHELGVQPDCVAGHSYGEFVALAAAGVFQPDDLLRLSHRRGDIIRTATQKGTGTMAALEADAATAQTLLDGLEGVTIANRNAPKQTVVSGTEAGIDAVLKRCQERQVRAQQIPVACAFHSPLVEAAREPLADAIAATPMQSPRFPVYANTTAKPYPSDPAAIGKQLAEHVVSPVHFREQIEAMYDAGVRVFIEVGAGNVLTGLVQQTLTNQEHLAVACDVKARPGLVQLQHLLGKLLTHGVPAQLDLLYRSRDLQPLNLERLAEEASTPTPTTWVSNSVRNRPYQAEEPLLLGQAPRPDHPGLKKLKLTEAPPVSPPTMPKSQPVSTSPPTTTPPVGVNGHHPAPTRPGPPPLGASDEATQVLLRFQDLMAKFLDTQKSIMTTFLNGDTRGLTEPTLPAMPTPATYTGNGYHSPATTNPAPVTSDTNGTPLPAEPAVVEASQAMPTLDRNWVENRLIDMVSERTGYPKEMLGLDLDLEADLGIDSIKRVEILGELAESMNTSDQEAQSGQLEMEKLTTIKTLRGIIDYLASVLTAATSSDTSVTTEPTSTTKPEATKPSERQLEVQRALVRLTDAPIAARPSLTLPSGVVLVTDDGRGVAQELANRMADFGQKLVFLRPNHWQEQPNSDVFPVDMTDSDAVESVIKKIRQQHGPIAGLVHLLPLAERCPEQSPGNRLSEEVKGLYLLARELGEEINRAGAEGGAICLAATSLGGGLGYSTDALPKSYAPGHGGILGFLKCLAQEWPDVMVRAIDFNLDTTTPTEVAERLLTEASDRTGPVEVGYLGHRRVTWEPYAAPLDTTVSSEPPLTSESTVLITGGARGITATIAQALAEQFQPNLVLLGRSPLPEESESQETASLSTPADIKAALIERFQREGRPVVPAAVETAFQRLLQDREIRSNLEQMRQAGAQVLYQQVDVRDQAALGHILHDLKQRFGQIDGVIHGAGVIEDKRIKDKTPESFDRVFGTKVDSALYLTQQLQPESLKFCIFFASVASRYGNLGQSDYAAANEVLSKLALGLNQKWPARVISIDWGPWGGLGMVADLEKHLVQKGLKLITAEEGPRFVIEELTFGSKADVEIIIAGGGENVARPSRSKADLPARVGAPS